MPAVHEYAQVTCSDTVFGTHKVDIDAANLGRDYPLAAGVNGDAKVTLQRLLELNGGEPAPACGEWLDQVRRIVTQWRDMRAPLIESQGAPIRPERLASELSRLGA